MDSKSNGVVRGSESHLGIATDLRTPPSKSLKDKDFVEKSNFSRRKRYGLQETATQILYDPNAPENAKGYKVQHRTCTCARFSHASGIGADILRSEKFSRAHYGGLMKCGNGRTCPVCSGVVAERKGDEMRLAMNQAPALGLHFSLLTFTAPHFKHDKLSVLKKQMQDANAKFWRGAPAMRFKSKFGIVGHIRSFEFRYGDNGWHPHFHILVVSEKPLPSTIRDESAGNYDVDLSAQSDDWKQVLKMWQSACERSGLRKPNEYGMDLRDGTHAGEYITKYGTDDEIMKTKKGENITWDMADEMTKGHVKKSSTSLAPFDFLELYDKAKSEGDEEKAREYMWLFRGWAKDSVNLCLLKWSNGLRSIFGMNEKEKSDEEIVAEQDDKASFLCSIPADAWVYIIKNRLRTLVLEIAELENPIQKLNTFFKAHGLEEVSLLRADQEKKRLEEKGDRAVDILKNAKSGSVMNMIIPKSEGLTKLKNFGEVRQISDSDYLDTLVRK